MTPSGKLTNDELIEASRVTGIPLIYIVKMDTFGLLNRQGTIIQVMAEEYCRVKEETGDPNSKISRSFSSHYNVPETWVKDAINLAKSRLCREK